MILGRAGRHIEGVLSGLMPGVGALLSSGEFLLSLTDGPKPEGAAFRDAYRNCLDQVTVPWVAPRGVTGMRITISVDLVEGDFIALAGRFGAYTETAESREIRVVYPERDK